MNKLTTSLATLIVTVTVAPAMAQDAPEETDYGNYRWEAVFGLGSWPSIGDLQPAVAGEFDELGLGLGFAVHKPVARSGNRELLFGIDMMFMSNDSNITLFSETLSTRAMYLTPSIKWVFGDKHRYSLDAGAGYYLIDITEVETFALGYSEIEVWQNDGFGGYLGATWDYGSRATGQGHGVTLSFRTHFFDLGRARDEDPFLPLRLGADAGVVEGPVYQFNIGYRWR